MSGRPWRGLMLAARAAWRWLRAFSGDAAYEAYLARAVEGRHLSRKAFYLDGLERRYRTTSRCC
ncbi:MAG TPA: CstA-like transporter-associated (seleno)protein [Vicinamibacteria bacterium]|nr:CstA-like transporter-associated (seleno)protein [Vicinamibacteria bacterium]